MVLALPSSNFGQRNFKITLDLEWKVVIKSRIEEAVL